MSDATITVRLTRLQIDEIAHKLSIVAEESGLQESYCISAADAQAVADLFRDAAPGPVTFPARYVDVIIEELEDRILAMSSNVHDAGDVSELSAVSSLRAAIHKINAAIRVPSMSVQHKPGPKVHLRSGGRSACRYSSRPSRRVLIVSTIQVFAETPIAARCNECQKRYVRERAAISKDTGEAS